jgi:hypothetical protein
MEQRFIDNATEEADDVAKRAGINIADIRDEFIEQLAEFRWDMFIADCSDDYFGRTLPEQSAARKQFARYLVELGASEDDAAQVVKRH